MKLDRFTVGRRISKYVTIDAPLQGLDEKKTEFIMVGKAHPAVAVFPVKWALKF
jgi:hypothetical protein